MKTGPASSTKLRSTRIVPFLASYPAIKPKGQKADPAALDVFGWIVNHFPFILCALAVLLIVLAIFRGRRNQKDYEEKLAQQDRLRAEWEKHRRE